MGSGIMSSCPVDDMKGGDENAKLMNGDTSKSYPYSSHKLYKDAGLTEALTTEEPENKEGPADPAGDFLPLVYQNAAKNETNILEQPLDFTTLAEKYNSFALDFIEQHKDNPFFLYMPFSHVHTTRNTPEKQYGA